MDLTAHQQKAATAVGNVAVTAGAGTGKTAMLAERFFHHVDVDEMRPIDIVAVTFTEKAAAELRQRIRRTLVKRTDDEEKIAEVDAAQISTLHALAARICRQFSHLVDISPDFRILTETESAIWLANKFDDAMSGVDEDIIRELHYSWLKEAIGKLLLDPHSASLALSRSADDWRSAIEKASSEALASLVTSNAWQTAVEVLPKYCGAPDDRLEPYRTAVLCAIEGIAAGDISSECLNVFKGFAKNLGSKKKWTEGLDETRKCLGDLRDAFKQLTPLITMAFGPADAIAFKKVGLLGRAFDTAYHYIREEKKKDKVLDFIDLEIYAAEILRDDRPREYYAKRWKAFLVDEFQDTNSLQAEIISLLTEDARLTVVGDEKQSIYGFRRADITVFQSVRSAIEASGGDVIKLSETFRSHQSLVVAMNDTFGPILGDLHQPLQANRKEIPHDEVSLSLAIVAGEEEFTDAEALVVESRFIAKEIRRMVDDGVTVFDKVSKQLRPIGYSDIAILSRKWSPLDVYIDALSAEGIPAVNVGGGNILNTRESKDAVAMLTFLADPTENISLGAILRSPFFAVSDRVLYELARSKGKDEPWWHIIQRSEREVGRARDILTALFAVRNKLSPEELLREADRFTGYTAAIANLPQGDRRQADWNGMLSLLGDIGRNGRRDLFGAVRQLRSFIEANGNIPRPIIDAGDAVILTSIHNAKGLEWSMVFVPDLSGETGGFGEKLLIDCDLGVGFEIEDDAGAKMKPAIHELIRRKMEDRDREEEKRLLYVAVTRARDKVILSSGRSTKKSTAIEFVMPAIEAAGIVKMDIPFSKENGLPPAPRDLPPFADPIFRNVEPVKTGLKFITATSLTDYAICPRKFRYIHVDGHPGLGEGEARARNIGILAHKALQFGIKNVESLGRIADGLSAEYFPEALELAEHFRSDPIFQEFQDSTLEKEKAFSFECDGTQIRGSADLVGKDFVLDYKTGEESDPYEFRFQLWAYAKAFEKPRAVVANLRNPDVYEFSAAEMKEAGEAAHSLIIEIAAGNFEAAPSPGKCARCVYSSICAEAATSRAKTESRAMTVPGQQLDLF